MNNLAKNGIDKMKNLGQESIKKLTEQPDDIFFSIVILIISFLIIFIIIFYIISQVTKKKDNINYIEKSYKIYDANTDSKEYTSFIEIENGDYEYPTKNGEDGKSTGRLCDYFIASSYNSCCSGDFKNDYVDIEALKNVIKRGARVLDFQLFYINGDIIVSASSDETEFIKGTYNYLYLNGSNGILETIKREAFSQSNGFKNISDPLFINLRIQSEKIEIYDKLTQMFNSMLGDKLLSEAYGYDGTKSSINIVNEDIKKFENKIIIICDQKNKNYENTSFYELINITPNREDGSLNCYRNYEINFAEERSNILEKTKKKLIMVIPDNTNINNNRDPENLFNMGCSMILMNYQRLDSNLTKYLNTFGQPQEYSNIEWEASAFMLKKEDLRENAKIIKNDSQPCRSHNDIGNYIIDIIGIKKAIRGRVVRASSKLSMTELNIPENGLIVSYMYLNGTCQQDKVHIFNGKFLDKDNCSKTIGTAAIDYRGSKSKENLTVKSDENGNYYIELEGKSIIISSNKDPCVDDDKTLHKIFPDLINAKWEEWDI